MKLSTNSARRRVRLEYLRYREMRQSFLALALEVCGSYTLCEYHERGEVSSFVRFHTERCVQELL
jgi:hypothetical protein